MSRTEADEVLLDVTRLVWRRWRGGVPTGVDRVCLAYLEHFSNARAVLQRSGLFLVLSRRRSQLLYRILREGGPAAQRRLVAFAFGLLPSAFNKGPARGSIYLNVGHTGLNEPALPKWIKAHRLRAIFLIHDIIPITHPQFCREGEAAKHELRMRNVLASASGIIGNSQATIDDVAALADRLRMPMPSSIAAWISGNPVRMHNAKVAGDRPYFVTLGTIEGRKNHRLLLQVWINLVARLGKSTPKLLIIGSRGWKADEVFHMLDALGPLADHVEEVGGCDDVGLATWVAGARALLMPSFTEGYGLPVFEALELGTPVIATDLPVYREVAGAIPTYLPPDDLAGWERAILDQLSETAERTAQLRRMKSFCAPTWEEHFAKVDAWL